VRSFERKLDRTLDHLGVLQALSQRFFEREPCGIILECDVQAREHVLYFRAWEDPPAEFASVAAECFHNLRQALDHIAYRLAITISGTDPPPNESSIYFPIAGTPQQFEGKLTSSFGSRQGIPTDIVTVLERAQPYNGGQWTLLSILDDLDNFDKHRFAPIVATGGLLPSFKMAFNVTSLNGLRLGPVKADTEILRFGLGPDSTMEMEFPVTSLIAFAEGRPGHGHPVIDLLWRLRELIRHDIAEPLDASL